jgi:hypothetical protein
MTYTPGDIYRFRSKAQESVYKLGYEDGYEKGNVMRESLEHKLIGTYALGMGIVFEIIARLGTINAAAFYIYVILGAVLIIIGLIKLSLGIILSGVEQNHDANE